MGEVINYLVKPEGWDPGIYELESYEQYAAIPALRSSELKAMKKSPAHYRASILNPKEPSAALEKSFAKGKAFDVLRLHGRDAFEKVVTVEPDLNRNTKAYKAWREAHQDVACLLSAKEKANIIEMHERAMSKQRFSEIFCGAGYPHRVIIWQCARTGLWCKAEIDWIREDGTVVDLKTTADAGFWFFSRAAYRLGYFNQGAYYLDGLTHVTGMDHRHFMLAAVEVEPPFESHVFRVSQDQLIKSSVENEENMWRLAKCLEADEWPGYPDEIMDIESGQYLYDDTELDDILMEDNANGF